MEDQKMPLGQCPKCKSLGTNETRRHWDMDRDPIEDILVAFRKCEGCGHAWEIILDRKPKCQPKKAAPE